MTTGPPTSGASGDDRDRWDEHLVPGTDVLVNELGAETADELARRADRVVGARLEHLAARPVVGVFDRAHLQAVHARLFTGVYPWAGQLRTVPLTTRGRVYVDPEALAAVLDGLLADVDARITGPGATAGDFPREGAQLFAQIELAHPFREGNGVTLRAYLSQLAAATGLHLDWSLADPEDLDAATRAVHEGDVDVAEELIEQLTTSAAPAHPADRPSPDLLGALEMVQRARLRLPLTFDGAPGPDA